MLLEEGENSRNSLIPVVDLGLHQVVDHGHGVLREAGDVHAEEKKKNESQVMYGCSIFVVRREKGICRLFLVLD